MGTKHRQIRIEEYFLQEEQRMASLGRWSTRKNYGSTRRSFSAYLQGRKLWVSNLDAYEIRQYNDFLDSRHVSRNSKSFYNRNLRALYNRAVRDGYAKANATLFVDVYTGIDRTRKKSLPIESIRRIIALDLSSEGELSLSRDIFVFSLFAQGMCFVDLAYLRGTNIRGDELCYSRKKTGQRIFVRIQPCMSRILERCRTLAWGDYLFPILHTSHPEEAYREYTYYLNRYNLHLKEIGRRAGCPFPLNSYAARHSWASLARKTGAPVAVISQGMGHTSERTTRIYLSDLDNSVLDEACQRVVEAVFSKK